jgi:MYXO-CTERM domain-containing protein
MRTAMILSVVAALGAARPAQACGGFFCNRQPPGEPLPVAQTGENVLFAMDPRPDGQSQLEAHIQIFYTGPADRFSWVVPVDGVPTVDVGSNRIFTALQALTAPSFGVDLVEEGLCKDLNNRPTSGNANSAPSATGVPGASGGAGGVVIAAQGSAGPFDYKVVSSADPQALVDWLSANMYFLSPEAEKLIRDYATEGKYFVALKLLPGKGVSEIQPIVLRFVGPGPCVPLRLTAVASVEDLRVNLWVLARTRVVPTNYYEFTVNQAKIDWLNGGPNYQKLLKEAANEAGGNAFTVEYAGPPVDTRAFVPAQGFDLTRLRAARGGPAALAELQRLGLNNDPSILEILRAVLPEPASLKEKNVSETAYYNLLATYWQEGTAFDGNALADAVESKIVAPLMNLQKLFAQHDKLTRLVTFISPEEMNVDPLFEENSTLPDVSNQHRITGLLQCGNRVFDRCNAPLRLVLEDRRSLWFEAPSNGGWCGPGPYDRQGLDAMPSLQLGWVRASAGDGLLRFDNTKVIDHLLDEHNGAVRGACGCDLGGRPGGSNGWWALVVGLALAVRRRRR